MPSAPPEPPSPMTAAIMGTSQNHHLAQVHRDGLRDVPLLRPNARISPRRVDQRDDRQPELVRQPHQPQRFAIAFRMRRAEIAQDVLLGVPAFLRANHHHFMPAEAGKPADHRPVLREQPVAVQLAEVGKGRFEVIQRERPLRMPGNLDPVPGAEVGEDLALGFLQLLLDQANFLLEADVEGVGFRVLLQLLKLVLQLHNRLFEVELMFHRPKPSQFSPARQRRFRTGKEPDLHPALSGDEVYTPSPRRSEG